MIQPALAVFLTVALIHISIDGIQAAEQVELDQKSEGNLASGIENPEWRIVREAGRKSGQNKKKSAKTRKGKPKQRKRKSKQNKKKSNQNKKRVNKNKKKLKKSRKKPGQKKLKKSRKKPGQKKSTKTRKKKQKQRKRKSRQKKKKQKRRKRKLRRNKKKSKQNKKRIKKKKKKSGQHNKKKNEIFGGHPKQACDVAALCKKIKDFIKISNQLRKVKRIVKACDTMDKKSNKSATEFDATAAALGEALGSGRMIYRSRWRRDTKSNTEVTGIMENLKKCKTTAKAKCEKTSVEACQNAAADAKCEKEIQAWLTQFGPAKGSCLQASADCCTCINNLPSVSPGCLNYDAKSTAAVNSKKKCVSGDEVGSFGYCRKLQQQAAEKGPGVACTGTSPNATVATSAQVTTAGPTTAAAATTAATTSGTAGCSVKCGVKKAGTKIVGGTEATVNEYPWMASLSMGCGGSVIADKWVLTAAHCFYNRQQTQQVITVPGSVIITIGEHDTFSTSETSLTKELKADKIIIHPSYASDVNQDHSVNDIALLRVPTPIDLKVYTPVCLPTQGKDYSGKKAWVYGWGALSSGGSTPAKLQELEVTVVTDASAKSSYQSVAGETLSDAQLAVMVFAGGEAGKDACQGDSGGPFTYSNPDNNGQHELVGAVSWGLNCAQAGLPGAYTEVSAFRTWVDGQISSNGGAIFTC